MRPRRSRSARPLAPRREAGALGVLATIGRAAIGGLLAVSMAVVPGSAQDVAKEGALFLLIPVGARAVGQGQAVVASRLGPEAIWWNPAALAWATKREVTIDHSKTFLLTGDAIDATFPAGRVGVLSASLLYFNFGNQDATDSFGSTVGTLYSHAVVLAGSYSATFGDRVAAGLTYKLVRQDLSCGGVCPGYDTYSVTTSAFDVGIQGVSGAKRELTVAAALRNIGLCAQVIDAEQCDPLPSRIHVGAEYRVDAVSRAVPGTTLHVTAEVVARPLLKDAVLRAGAELGLADRAFVRGGFITGNGTGSGDGTAASVGFGLRKGTLGLEFARTFGGLSADAGEPPTYITLRFAFR